MRWVALPALLLLLAPAASGCSLAYPPADPSFAWLQWTNDDALEFGYQGGFYAANITTGMAQALPEDPAPGAYKEPPGPSASAPDGKLSLRLWRGRDDACSTNADGMTSCTQPTAVMVNSCTGQPDVPIRGAELVRSDGTAVHRWGGFEGWSGTFWGNATHGFVWEHANSTLSTVAWSTGGVSSTRLMVQSNATYAFYAGSAPQLLGDRLFLYGSDGVTFIDPRGPSAKTVLSPFKDGFKLLDDDHLAFGKWVGQDLSFVYATLDGDVVWQASAHGTDYYWNARSLVVHDDDAHSIARWLDGRPLPPIDIGDPGSAVFAGHGDLLAIGLRGGTERLLVFAEDQTLLYEFDGDDDIPIATTPTTTGVAMDASAAPDDDKPASVEVAPWFLIAMAVALALRRRFA
jgi:MYXO-CTERM domain-containing protein